MNANRAIVTVTADCQSSRESIARLLNTLSVTHYKEKILNISSIINYLRKNITVHTEVVYEDRQKISCT